MGRLSFDKLKDFFFGKPEELKEPETGNINTDDDEQAAAVPYTNRHPWGDFSLLQSLTPEHLTAILNNVKRGECPADYLELAQDIELKDLHYRSVLSTRKDAITGLEIKVVPASEDRRDMELADAVDRDIVKNTSAKLYTLIRDMLDALAKGFSVSEIIWDTDKTPWKPKAYKFRDPRWFQYDTETGKTLMLRAPLGSELEPLKSFHFVVHEPHLISGNQITAGLALPALYYWMLKSYDVTSWAAFIDRYGYPIRIGKYGKKATEQDRATLKRAVAAIGQDFGAVIPESAVLDIIESKHAAETSNVYKNMADWVDKQISKLVLGQTMTVDEGASRAQSETHEKVRDDIADSDIQQVVETLNSALTIPYINLNFGEQENYPKIDLFKPDEKNIEQIISAVEKLGPQGLEINTDEMRSLLGLSNPEKDDEVIGGRAIYAPSEYGLLPPGNGSDELKPPSLNAEQVEIPDELDALIDESGGGYIPVSDDIAAVIEKAADRATDFESFREELQKLVKDWPPDKIAECIAVATFKARALGDAEFEKEE
jgi:phage gp29-like protein